MQTRFGQDASFVREVRHLPEPGTRLILFNFRSRFTFQRYGGECRTAARTPQPSQYGLQVDYYMTMIKSVPSENTPAHKPTHSGFKIALISAGQVKYPCNTNSMVNFSSRSFRAGRVKYPCNTNPIVNFS